MRLTLRFDLFALFALSAGLSSGCDAQLGSASKQNSAFSVDSDPSGDPNLSGGNGDGTGDGTGSGDGNPDDPGGLGDRTGTVNVPNQALCELSPPQFRLLTNEQYDNTVRDLLGTSQSFGKEFPGEPVIGGFTNNAAALTVNAQLVQGYAEAAEALSQEAVQNRRDALMPCDTQRPRCVRHFIRDFGRRAYRRPLAVEEIDDLYASFEAGLEYDFSSGIEFVVNAMLQSPSFTYSLETVDSEGRLEPFALASKLSYFLWNSMPDDELLDAAESGELSDPVELARQAERMIDDERSREAIRSFARQWLHLEEFSLSDISADEFPEYFPAMVDLWQEQLLRFVEEAVFSGEGFEDLMNGDYMFVNDDLASIYGVEEPGSNALARVELPQGYPRGLLAQPGLMAIHDKGLPAIHRGKFVLTQLLCRPPPPPPDELEVPSIDKVDLSLREYTDQLTLQGSCAVCHNLMNPMGHALGEFDGLGRVTDVDSHGFDVDASVEFRIDGESVGVSGAADLADLLVESAEARQCFVRNWYRYAASRVETKADACSVSDLVKGFDGDVRALLLAIVTDDSFTHGASL